VAPANTVAMNIEEEVQSRVIAMALAVAYASSNEVYSTLSMKRWCGTSGSNGIMTDR